MGSLKRNLLITMRLVANKEIVTTIRNIDLNLIDNVPIDEPIKTNSVVGDQ